MFASAVDWRSNYGKIIEASVKIIKNAPSSKKAKEDAEDKVHYLDGVDEDDENEEGVGSAELEEAIEQLVNNSISALSFVNGALQSETQKKKQ